MSAIMICAVSILGTSAQDRPEHELHSMMIYNFLKYIQWPDDQSGGEFVITVLGDDDVYNTLNTWYANKPKNSKKIVVKKAGSPTEVANSHLVYVGSRSSNDFDAVLAKVNSSSTLVITDKKGLAEKGSGINFRIINNRLKFELNEQAVTKANLKVSSQLSAMAIII